MTGELFQLMADIKMQHVPYRGSTGARRACSAGKVDLMFEFGVALPMAQAGHGARARPAA